MPDTPSGKQLWGVQTEKGFHIVEAETMSKASQKTPGKTLHVDSVKEIKSKNPTGQKWGVLTDKGFHVVDAATESAASQKAPGKTISVMQHGKKIVGWRRVTGGKDCALCREAAQKLYHTSNLMPIHEHCSCGVAPVFEGDEHANMPFHPKTPKATEKGLGAPRLDPKKDLTPDGEVPMYGVDILEGHTVKSAEQVGTVTRKLNTKPEWKNFEANLSNEQRQSISFYQSSGFHRMNDSLRKRSMAGQVEPHDLISRIETLDTAFVETSGYRMKVYRGAGRASPERLQEKFGTSNLDDLVGTVWSDDAYLSTSLKPEVAGKFGANRGVLMEIDVPEGARALYMNARKGSSLYTQEYEVLFPRGTQLVIKSVEQTKFGVKLKMELQLEKLSPAQASTNRSILESLRKSAVAERKKAEASVASGAKQPVTADPTQTLYEHVPSWMVDHWKSKGWTTFQQGAGGKTVMKKVVPKSHVTMAKKELAYGSEEYYAAKGEGWIIVEKKGATTVLTKPVEM